MLWLYQRVFWENFNPDYGPEGRHRVLDLNFRELVILAPLMILIFWIGFYPDLCLSYMHASVENLLKNMNAPAFAGNANLISKLMEIF